MTLHAYLAYQALSQIERKGFFTGRYFWLGEYLSIATWMYETSSVLGYTYRDRLSKLVELMAEEGRTDDLMNFITTPATERMSKLKKTPQNFYEFYFETEAMEFMNKLHAVENDWHDFLLKAFKVKMRIDVAMPNMHMAVLEGIGFGYKYPELVEKFLSYKHDADQWKKFYSYGLDIGPTPPQNLPLTSHQVEAKKILKPFIEKIRPALLDLLELKNF